MKEIEEYLGRVLVPREKIRSMVMDLGARITNDYRGKELFLIGVLKGGFMFLADLVREIRIPVEMDLSLFRVTDLLQNPPESSS